MPVLAILFIGFSGVFTFFGIAIFRRHSLDRAWLDIPNQRSSHDRPTPRGAGMVIVPVCLAGYFLASQFFETRFSLGYFLGAMLVALVSWIDDLYSISFLWRLLTHLLAALIMVTSEAYWNTFSFGNDVSYALGWVGPVATVLWIVWIINAYNFMDGIDGIAAVQGLAAAAAWGFIFAMGKPGSIVFPMIVFASLVGFIFHNWHPAKVFIGDVGSAFLGFTFASMPLMIAGEKSAISNLLPLASILILWPFIFDTGLTLVRRALRGEMLWQAHRQHLYQLLVISGYSQPTVTITYGIFAIFTSAAAVLLVHGFVNSTVMLGIIFMISMVFAVTVAVIYKRRSQIIEQPNGI